MKNIYLVLCLSLLSPFLPAAQVSDNATLIDRVTGLKRPWGAEFLSDGKLLVSELEGTLKLFDSNFKLINSLEKPQDLDQRRIARFDNSGAFDVAIGPNFVQNQFIYWSYAAQEGELSYLKVVRYRLTENQFKEPVTIFDGKPANKERFHYGGALLFTEENQLLIAVGEKYSNAAIQGNNPVAQDPEDPRGKIWQITNPHLSPQDKNFKAVSIALGTRNVQSIEKVKDSVYFGDHGPIGGDEINLLTSNTNYGWPIKTPGIYKVKDYSPPEVSETNFTPPFYSWDKVTMAPSGLLYYKNNRWPQWKDHLFVSGLSSGRLQLFSIEKNNLLFVEELVIGIRQRDVIASSDGRIFILTDEPDGRVIEVNRKKE